VPRQANWLRVEARIKSEPVTRASTPNRFGVGHVIALWGQSEVVRIRSTVYDQAPPEPLLSDESVQAMWFEGGPVVKHLSSADPHTAALAAMANVFMAERRGLPRPGLLRSITKRLCSRCLRAQRQRVLR